MSLRQSEADSADLNPLAIAFSRKNCSILSAYDDLIENNRRRIQLLEQAARLLYKEWFVRLRFPGHEHVKIINGIPEGWERKLVSRMDEKLKMRREMERGLTVPAAPSEKGYDADIRELNGGINITSG